MPQLFPGICGYYRDNEHPLMVDAFKCMLQTPSVLETAKATTGCRR
jgi:hypothetical protein